MLGAEQTLLNICELIVDCEHKTAPAQETGYPSIRTPNIGRGRLILDGVNRVSEETYQEWSKRAIPQADDLILAREAPVGNVAIIPKNLKVCLGQRTVLIRPDKNKVSPMFLVYFLLGDEIQSKLLGHSTGATVSHLNMRDIRNLELPKLSSLPTQRKIATVLSAYDDLIENNTRRIEILEEMAQAIYREWFAEFRFPGHEQVPMVESELGLIPQGWEVGLIDKLIDFKSGYAFKSKTFVDQGDYNVVTIKNVKDGEFQPVCDNRINDLPSKLSDHCRLKNGDILLSLTGYIGRVCLVYGKNYLLNQRVAKLVPKNSNHYPFIYTMFRQRDLQLRLETIATGVAQQNLSPIKAGKLPCLIPSPRLLTRFSNSVKPYIDQILNLNQKNSNLRQTRDLLLPKLISGEINISELNIDISGSK